MQFLAATLNQIYVSSKTNDANLTDPCHLWTAVTIIVIWKIWQEIDVLLTTCTQATNTTVCCAA